MRTRHLLAALVVLAGLAWPHEASAQIDPISNLGACPASTGYDAAATSIVVATGCGASLPTAATNYGWCNTTDYPYGCKDASGVSDPNYEVVRCTRSTDTLTCTRAQESTSASTKNTSGKTYWLTTLTAKTFTDINTGFGAAPLFTPGTSANATWLNERVLALGTSLSGTDGGAGSTYTINTIQDIRTSASPSFIGATISGLTADRLVTSSTGGLLQSDNFRVDSTNGYLGIGMGSGLPEQRLNVRHNWTAQTTTLNQYHEVVRISSSTAGGGNVTTPHALLGMWLSDDASAVAKTITNAVNNGSGLIRITATGHTLATGDAVGIYGVVGTTEANNVWDITVIDANTFDLQGSTFTNAYVSGGTVTTRSMLGAIRIFVQPSFDRTSTSLTGFNDDFGGIGIDNPTLFKATDAYYVGNGGPSGSPAWNVAFATDADSYYHFRAIGEAYSAGLDMSLATMVNDVPAIDLGQGHRINIGTTAPTQITARTIDTNADGAFAAASFGGNFTKNDTNARAFPVVQIKPTLNFGGSNTSTTINVLDLDTTNTSTTGATVNLAALRYGGSERLSLSSSGTMNLSSDAQAIFGATTYVDSTTATSFQLRKYRGTLAAARRVQSGDSLGNFTFQGGQAVDGTSLASAANSAQLRATALDTFDASNQGSRVELRSVAQGTTGVIDRFVAGSSKNLTDNSATSVVSMTIANGSSVGGLLTYTIEATDGTDYQIETGQVVISAVNKAGTVTATVTEINSQQTLSASSMTTDWTISAANPTVISVNANTALTPSGGYPRINFSFQNLGRQAVTYP